MKNTTTGLLVIAILMAITASSQTVNLNSGTNWQVISSGENLFSADLTITNIHFSEITNQYGNFFEISADGLEKSHQTGKPNLPVYYALIAIPHNAEAILNYNIIETHETPLPIAGVIRQIYPVQLPVPKSGERNQAFILDTSVYQSNEYYREPLLSSEYLGQMRGIKIMRLAVSPFSYNPVNGILEIATKIKVEVQFSGGNPQETRNEYIRTYSPHFTPVFNSLQNHSWFTSTPAKDTLSRYPMKYAIIADTMFQQTLQPFIEWKTQMGFNVVQIYKGLNGVGHTAADIRLKLDSIYQAATPTDPPPTYVLVVGDVNQIPAFPSSIQGFNHPTDLYYAEYDNDYLPEAYFGRFSAETPEQLQAQIDKTLMHEKYLFPDPIFLRKSILIAGHDNAYGPLHGNGQINYAANYYFKLSNGINSSVFLYPASSALATQIRQEINAGAAVVNYTAHGTPTSWQNPAFTNSHVLSMTNINKTGVMIGNACNTNRFSIAVCLGEALLRVPQKGAVAYIGASNNTYWDPDYYWSVGVGNITANPSYDSTGLGVYDSWFHTHGEPYAEWYTTTGQMIFAGNISVMKAVSTLYLRKYWEIYHVMGDPSLMPYLGVPTSQIATYNPLITNLLNWSVQTTPYAYVGLSAGGVLHGAALADSNGIANLNIIPFTSPGQAQLVITAQNKQPYISNVNVILPNIPYVLYHDHTIIDDNQNGKAEYGENIILDVKMRNFTHFATTGVNAMLRSSDPNIIITDSTAYYGNFNAYDTISLANAFSFTVNQNIPDKHKVNFTIFSFDSLAHTWNSSFELLLYAPKLSLGAMIINDSAGGNGNGYPEPGENILIKIPVLNSGSAPIDSLNFTIQSNNQYFTVSGNPNLNQIKNGATDTVEFIMYVSPLATNGMLAEIVVNVHAGAYSFSNPYLIMTGFMIEDFETNNFSKFNWQHGGNQTWTINDTIVYEGIYSAQSGSIDDDETSELSVTMNVIEDDSIRFYVKVSSEADWDFLYFSIDNEKVGEWSGETPWQYAAFKVKKGVRKFSWVYAKDYYMKEGKDCAWLDYIVFPANDVKSGITNKPAPASANILIYPNPATSELFVRWESDDNSPALIEIFNRNAMLIYSKADGFNGSNEKQINVSTMPQGMYFLRITTAENSYTKPFIIIKQ